MEYRAYEYNRACEMADNIVNYHHKKLPVDGSYAPVIRKWQRIKGFRMMESVEKTVEEAKEAAMQWIRGNSGSDLAFVLVRDDNECGVFFGTGEEALSSFETHLPETEMCESGPKDIRTEYNGFVIGSAASGSFADTILNLDADGYYVACVMLPYTPQKAAEKISETERNIALLNRFRSYTRTYGTATRRTEEIENPVIVKALEVLRETDDFLNKNMADGLVRLIIKVGAKNKADLERLLWATESCMHVERDYCIEPVRAFRVTGSEDTWKDHLSVPALRLMDRDCCRPFSLQLVSDLAKLSIPPMQSHKDYFVKNYGTNENSVKIFESRLNQEKGIVLGKNADNEEIIVPTDLLCCHAAVLGSAGGGKTTTVKQILLSLHKSGIPFLVIEAAKKEYFDLSADVPELQVYTPGTNGSPLVINPVQPEDGTLIENQVDMLVRAITASHGGEHPIPEGIEGLLRLTYEKAGWKYGMLAYHDPERPFPTFTDVYANVDEYVRDHARYGSENRQNLSAALSLRTENLYSGALGRVCSSPDGLTAKDLLSYPTLLELDDFSESAVVFLMNVVLFKVQSYLSKQEKTESLKRVIVVEEAHNVFRKNTSDDHGRDISNRYFERMLSEIRASGTGMIVSDQRPSILSEALMENTAVKIIHAMEERADREVVSSSLDLSEIQMKKLRELIPGECILGLRGHFGLHDVYVKKPETSGVKNVFCPMCPKRFGCEGVSGHPKAKICDEDRIRSLVGTLVSDPYNTPFVKRICGCIMDEIGVGEGTAKRCCVLGELLVRYAAVPVEVKRIIVASYYGH